jgi:hypothetical protein
MYFPDLTPYEYGQTAPQTNVLNVGWLSAAHAFPIGIPNERLVQALRRLIASPVNLYRGWHICEFCPGPPTIVSPGRLPMLDPPQRTMGNGEIRVVATASGITYVAPVLVLHYVVAHGYLPPPEFIDAAIEATTT